MTKVESVTPKTDVSIGSGKPRTQPKVANMIAFKDPKNVRSTDEIKSESKRSSVVAGKPLETSTPGTKEQATDESDLTIDDLKTEWVTEATLRKLERLKGPSAELGVEVDA